MRPWTRPLNAAALAFALVAVFNGIAAAASIPAKAAQDPKTLWRIVMEDYYGPYSKALKCWTARIGADHVCMRPHRLDQVTIRGVNHLFLVIGGSPLGDDGQPQEAHVDSGMLGLIVLRQDGATFRLAARNDLHTPFGSFGNVPSEDAFAVREIGPDDTYGWVATDGWVGQGHVLTSATIFAPVGDKVVNIGNIPDHYDNSGNCENGKVIGSDVACTDYSSELIFDSADPGGRFYPVIVKVTGTREGVAIDRTFTTTFDPGTFAYRKIEGLPEEFADGI